MSKPIVSLVNVEKWYGTNHVVKNMNINIAEGEFLTLLGPSGCGKTTTLRMISGFELPTSGVIKVQGGERREKRAVSARCQHGISELCVISEYECF